MDPINLLLLSMDRGLVKKWPELHRIPIYMPCISDEEKRLIFLRQISVHKEKFFQVKKIPFLKQPSSISQSNLKNIEPRQSNHVVRNSCSKFVKQKTFNLKISDATIIQEWKPLELFARGIINSLGKNKRDEVYDVSEVWMIFGSVLKRKSK